MAGANAGDDRTIATIGPSPVPHSTSVAADTSRDRAGRAWPRTGPVDIEIPMLNGSECANEHSGNFRQPDSGVSYHTPLPTPYATNAAGQEVGSFIYHI